MHSDKVYQILSCVHILWKGKLDPQWESFALTNAAAHDLVITVHSQSTKKYGIEILGLETQSPVLRYGTTLICGKKNWTEAEVFLGDSQELSPALCTAVLTHLSVRSAFLMHASLIEYDNQGVIFLGPSGIGKTTQAELWERYRGADIINGDMVFVRKHNDEFKAYGSPWHGSSPYCLNRNVPLKAVIVLKQNTENKMKRLTGMDMLRYVLNNIFIPEWFERGTEIVLETVDTLLSAVPVYELSCRPDEDAVRLTEETIFKQEK